MCSPILDGPEPWRPCRRGAGVSGGYRQRAPRSWPRPRNVVRDVWRVPARLGTPLVSRSSPGGESPYRHHGSGSVRHRGEHGLAGGHYSTPSAIRHRPRCGPRPTGQGSRFLPRPAGRLPSRHAPEALVRHRHRSSHRSCCRRCRSGGAGMSRITCEVPRPMSESERSSAARCAGCTAISDTAGDCGARSRGVPRALVLAEFRGALTGLDCCRRPAPGRAIQSAFPGSSRPSSPCGSVRVDRPIVSPWPCARCRRRAVAGHRRLERCARVLWC